MSGVNACISFQGYKVLFNLILKPMEEQLTVPATDFDDMKVFALNLDNPKSQT